MVNSICQFAQIRVKDCERKKESIYQCPTPSDYAMCPPSRPSAWTLGNKLNKLDTHISKKKKNFNKYARLNASRYLGCHMAFFENCLPEITWFGHFCLALVIFRPVRTKFERNFYYSMKLYHLFQIF